MSPAVSFVARLQPISRAWPRTMLGRGEMANVQLAEQFFLISHDEISGRPVVGIERIECGLVGAMFGELIIDGRLGIKDGLIVVLDKEPVGGGLSDSLVNTVD